MDIHFKLTKLIVADPQALERFYMALGFKIVERRYGEDITGVGDVAQEQTRLSQTGDESSHLIVLARFINFDPPAVPGPPYPGPYWLVIHTSDVDASIADAVKAGGSVHREPEDVGDPRHPWRAGIIRDPEGNFIELFGPKTGEA